MASKPTVVTFATVSRLRRTVADQLITGLVMGGLLGPGFAVDRWETDRIHFSRVGGRLQNIPERGEIELSTDEQGDTRVRVALWCRRMAVRRFLVAALVGGLVATLTSLVFGWLIHWTLPVGGAVAVIYDVLVGWHQRSHFSGQIQAFIRNTSYLTTM